MQTPVQWISNGLLITILSAVIYAIINGNLVPGKTHKAELEESKKVVALWREAAETKNEALSELVPMIKESLDNDRIVVALVTAMKEGFEYDRNQVIKGGQDAL